MKTIYSFLIGFVSLTVASCDILEPMNDTHDTEDRLTENIYAEGILFNGYTMLPTGKQWNFSDVATDDAVSNDSNNQFRLMAEGRWSANYSPISQWAASMRAINYLNQFLYEVVDNVRWGKNDATHKLFLARLKGEAYALRAVHKFYALQDVAGKVGGQLYGIQITDRYLDEGSNYDIPRETFEKSLESIYADLDAAADLLPLVYKNISNEAEIPEVYGDVSVADYNMVMGDLFRQRIQKRIVLAYKAKVALMAASPAYNPDGQNEGDARWEKAAQLAADALKDIVLSPNGHRYFEGAQVNSVPLDDRNDNEMCWRTQNLDQTSSLEKRVFPPSLNGNGDVNPTQNFVDAFPMADGYPYGDPNSQYTVDPENPYANRDPRLARSVIYNGSTFKNAKIVTGVGGGLNAKDSTELSTRTGYYLRKLVREDVNFNNDGAVTNQKHYWVHVRYTEIFLAYAEAANEFGGPDYAVPGYGKTAREVVGEIRKRAGIAQPDGYLASITGRDDMRKLIRNERRLELAFEGFRFYDLRRWNLPLGETARGVRIENGEYEYMDIEPRVFEPYMIYGPLPERDVLSFPALKQNDGWK